MRCLVAICLLAAVCGACATVHGTPAPTTAAAVTADPVLASCARRGKGDLPAREPGLRQGSAVALARSGEELLAYVADADSRSVHTLSIDGRRELVRTRVDGAPRQLMVLGDGRVVASLSDGTRIEVLEPQADPKAPLARLCEREVAAEPWGLALSADDGKLVVASGWGAALTVFDASFAQERVIPLARDPRSVLVTEDGVALVSHLVGAKMTAVNVVAKDSVPTVVDLSTRKSSGLSQTKDMYATRTGAQGYALAKVSSRVFAPMVSVDPGEFERPTSIYYGPAFDGIPKEVPTVSVVDPARLQPLSKYVLGTTEVAFVRECLIPRAAAIREDTKSLLVACFGIDSLVELDALAVDPFRAERRRFDVPPGPEGVAVDATSKQAVVFSQLAGSVTVIDLAAKAPAPATFELDYHPDPTLAGAAQGRQLFYRTDDTRISNDGVACASCHPDGRDDGNTWTTPSGPRQTPMLAGRVADTAPYGWEGDKKTLPDYISNTVVRLGGKGLQDTELDALSRFLLAVKGPPHATDATDLVRRGKDLFQADTQGCSGCHSGGATTDAKVHDIGANVHDSMSDFDTPSLSFVRGTAPYFHDGRYSTLEALLEDPNSKMGHTADLSAGDRSALVAYLRTR